MFRAVPCSSSGGQIVLSQPLVSSLSVNSRTVSRLRADSADFALNLHTVRPFTESDDTRGCNNTICPPEDEQSTARNMLRIDYILITNLMHWLLFIHKILFSSTCFEPQVLIFRRIQLYTCSICYCHSLWEFLVACRYTHSSCVQTGYQDLS